MHPWITEFLVRQRDTAFADFQGAEIVMRIPVREAIVNDLLAHTVVAAQPSLHQLTVAIGDRNELDIHVRSPIVPFAPLLALRFTIDREVRFDPHPTLALAWRRQGLTGWAAALLPLFERLLPPDVTRTRDGLTLNLGAPIERYRLGPLIPLIKSIEVTSEPGMLWVGVRLAV